MIDLHCHLLPGVDDGSRSVEQSVRVLDRMLPMGVGTWCLTPHLLASRGERGIPERHDVAFQALQSVAPEGVTLHRGVELMMDRPLTKAMAENRRLTLGGSRYLLIEFTRLVSGTVVANAVQQVRKFDLWPVIAHPERYSSCSVGAVAQWKERGALIQVDATTLLRPTNRGTRARALVEAGLADILAADNHGDERNLAEVSDWLGAQGASPVAELLTAQNPARILADDLTESVPPVRIKTSLFTKIRTLFTED